jgi:hypothetical protein
MLRTATTGAGVTIAKAQDPCGCCSRVAQRQPPFQIIVIQRWCTCRSRRHIIMVVVVGQPMSPSTKSMTITISQRKIRLPRTCLSSLTTMAVWSATPTLTAAMMDSCSTLSQSLIVSPSPCSTRGSGTYWSHGPASSSTRTPSTTRQSLALGRTSSSLGDSSRMACSDGDPLRAMPPIMVLESSSSGDGLKLSKWSAMNSRFSKRMPPSGVSSTPNK